MIKEPREGWIELNCEGIDSEGREFTQCDMYFSKVEGLVHVREVLPDHIDDTMRLEWITENKASVTRKSSTGWWVNKKNIAYNTPREAIDAAMKKEDGGVL